MNKDNEFNEYINLLFKLISFLILFFELNESKRSR